MSSVLVCLRSNPCSKVPRKAGLARFVPCNAVQRSLRNSQGTRRKLGPHISPSLPDSSISASTMD